MKAIIALFSTLFATSAFAGALNVRLTETETGKFSIHFSTKAQMSSMCRMEVTRLDITKSLDTVMGEPTTGKIVVSASVSPMTMCLMAFGPHSGAVTLDRGYALPAVNSGRYQLVINKEKYGMLTVAEDGVTLEQPDVTTVSLEGTVMTGIMAIGGETTGTLLMTTAGAYELSFDHASINIEDFRGKKVRVTGQLTERPGIEVPLRRIVTVDRMVTIQ